MPAAEDEDDQPAEDYTAANAGSRPIGELADARAAVETLHLPDDTAQPGDSTEVAAAKPKARRLQVPNFKRFRLRLTIGVLVLAVIIIGLYICLGVLPKAAIAITTETSDMNVSLTATLDDSATTVNTAKGVVPAKVEQQQKTSSQQVSTTGQKNTGTAATGSVSLSSQACSPPYAAPDIPAGTGLSANDLTFITQSVPSFAPVPGADPGCVQYQADGVNIAAQNGGTKYNLNDATFTVAGHSDTSATGSTTGGTDQIIHTVAQADIDSATQQLAVHDTGSIKASLDQALLQDGMYPLSATFKSGKPAITASSKVGDTADTVTVTQVITYTMYGASKADLETLIAAQLTGQIDMHTQSIVNDGLDSAAITVADNGSSKEQVSVQTKATVGPTINPDTVKQQTAGKKAGDVKNLIGAMPGVTGVDVHLSPFWVGAVPSKVTRITVTVSGSKQG